MEPTATQMDTQTGQSGPSARTLQLGIAGFDFVDLHRPERLADLHATFLRELEAADPALAATWKHHWDGTQPKERVEESTLLIDVARHVAAFVARLFRIEAGTAARREYLKQRQIVYTVRDRFVKKKVRGALLAAGQSSQSVHQAANELLALLPGMLGVDRDAEERWAGKVLLLLDRPASERAVVGRTESVEQALDLLALDFKLRRDAGDPALARWRCLFQARDLDWENGLVHTLRPYGDLPEALEGSPQHFRRRDGFKLTDDRGTVEQALAHVDRCVFCHEREKDSCSRGLFEKKTGALSKNPLGIELAGCPLDERISEMHQLFAEGDPLAALSMVMVDNPMCPGTGHRICNDCMKACIYQKQEPVNIPHIETNVLTQVLELDHGPEIYLLLTRWNPLRAKRPFTLPYNGVNVLVVGLGPAGYTLAHYLCQEGFGVVGIDGLKIEPLPSGWTGVRTRAEATQASMPPIALERYARIKSELDQRVLLGFGGVSEYGITVRWDKNFLTLPYLSLLRRDNFELHGGVRFGGTLDLDDAWQLGFDHVAVATGAGKPTIVEMKNNLSRGVRKASDFLMALQLTGAFKKDSLANLQLRLPVVVIGGGLTGIDTATEALAYYPVQVEKTVGRYDTLCQEFGEERIRRFFSDEEKLLLDEFLEHGRAVVAERERATRAGEAPDFVALVRGWGGVRLVYRRKMSESPAYRLNHEEIEKALEEGITFVENLSPKEIQLDKHGAVRGIVFERQVRAEDANAELGPLVEMKAGTVLVAAGTSPNTMYAKEKPGSFRIEPKRGYFQLNEHRAGALSVAAKTEGKHAEAFFTSYDDGKHTVSVYGDNHAHYAGNVVKAMASARDGFVRLSETFRERLALVTNDARSVAERRARWKKLVQKLDFEWQARVHQINRLTPTITEVVVHAPAAARNFKPGQFYRLQNFETTAALVDGSRLAFEGIALTGAWTDPQKGLLSMIVLEMGVSSRLCALLKPGERVVVMGPTGTPTEIPHGERVILCGGGLGNAVLFSIGRALRANGCEVIYFSAFRRGEDLFKREEIESAADVVVWSTDNGAEIVPDPSRPFDRHFRGNVVQAMVAYAKGELYERKLELSDCQRMIVIGSDRMMNAVREARTKALQPFLAPRHVAIGSINSPMQCMMKEICAQCLCKHKDPETGAEIAPVFSCFNQDQELDRVDFDNLNQRLRANSVQEKLSNLWLDHLVHAGDLPIWATL